MRDKHIIKIIEEKSIGYLSESEITIIESHIVDCPDCSQAYDAARISEVLIQSRASEVIDPSPFFKTRVMAAIRERELTPELPAFVRLWKAAGALVSMMAMLLVVLIGVTFFSYAPDAQSLELTASQSIYSPEYVVFEQGRAADENTAVDEDLAYDQVLATMYESGNVDGE